MKPSRRRPVVGYLCGVYRVSQRHACGVARVAPSTLRYQSIREPRTALRLRIREIAQVRVRYGYRKIRVLLNREGWQVGKKLVYRLYHEEGLALRQPARQIRGVLAIQGVVQDALGIALHAGELVVVVERVGDDALGPERVEVGFLHDSSRGVGDHARRANMVGEEIIDVPRGRVAPRDAPPVEIEIFGNDGAAGITLRQHVARDAVPVEFPIRFAHPLPVAVIGIGDAAAAIRGRYLEGRDGESESQDEGLRRKPDCELIQPGAFDVGGQAEDFQGPDEVPADVHLPPAPADAR